MAYFESGLPMIKAEILRNFKRLGRHSQLCFFNWQCSKEYKRKRGVLRVTSPLARGFKSQPRPFKHSLSTFRDCLTLRTMKPSEKRISSRKPRQIGGRWNSVLHFVAMYPSQVPLFLFCWNGMSKRVSDRFTVKCFTKRDKLSNRENCKVKINASILH